MKMWVVKTVHLPERVRNFNRYKRPILAFLISTVLMISIIYLGRFFPTAKSGSGGSSNSFEIYFRNATFTNVTLEGPYTYNSLNVTKTTVDVADLSEMLLTKEEEGSRLELAVPSANATKLIVYTTYLTGWTPLDNLVKIKCYGNETVYLPAPELLMFNAYMEVVYMHAESFSALGLSLTCT